MKFSGELSGRRVVIENWKKSEQLHWKFYCWDRGGGGFGNKTGGLRGDMLELQGQSLGASWSPYLM